MFLPSPGLVLNWRDSWVVVAGAESLPMKLVLLLAPGLPPPIAGGSACSASVPMFPRGLVT